MMGEQSWNSCLYSLGDSELDIEAVAERKPRIKLLRAAIQEAPEDKLLREEGIDSRYYCTCQGLIRVRSYREDKLPRKDGISTPVAQLFHLDIFGEKDLDLFGKDKQHLEEMIQTGLAMCTHCKFYKKK